MVQDIMSAVTTTFSVKKEEVNDVASFKSIIIQPQASHQAHHHGGSHDTCVQCLNYQVVPVTIAPITFTVSPGNVENTPYVFSHVEPFYKILRRPPKT